MCALIFTPVLLLHKGLPKELPPVLAGHIAVKGPVDPQADNGGLKGPAQRLCLQRLQDALIRVTQILALEFAPAGVRVNAICPGVTETDILGTVAPEQMKQLKMAIPMGRLGQPAEIAAASVFMVSDDASYMTGQAIAIDGGYTVM